MYRFSYFSSFFHNFFVLLTCLVWKRSFWNKTAGNALSWIAVRLQKFSDCGFRFFFIYMLCFLCATTFSHFSELFQCFSSFFLLFIFLFFYAVSKNPGKTLTFSFLCYFVRIYCWRFQWKRSKRPFSNMAGLFSDLKVCRAFQYLEGIVYRQWGVLVDWDVTSLRKFFFLFTEISNFQI